MCRDTQKACPAGKLGSMQGFTSATSSSATLQIIWKSAQDELQVSESYVEYTEQI